MSDEDYNKREKTFRKFREQNRLNQPESVAAIEEAEHGGNEGCDSVLMAGLRSAVDASRRCTVEPGSRRGVLRYGVSSRGVSSRGDLGLCPGFMGGHSLPICPSQVHRPSGHHGSGHLDRGRAR